MLKLHPVYFLGVGLNFICLSVTLASTQDMQPGFDDRARGIQQYRENHLPQAIKSLKEAVKKNQEDSEAWYFLGLAQLRKENLKEATKCLEESLRLRPSFAHGHAALAYVLLVRNRPKEAYIAAEEALKLNNRIADAFYVIGVIRLRERRRDEALKSAESAIQTDPNFAPPYLLKSQALVNVSGGLDWPMGSSAERITLFSQAADAMEKFLELAPPSERSKDLEEQLKTLRFYGTTRERSNAYTGREVTKKARVLKKPQPSYPESARKNEVTGTVVLRAVLASDGTVKHILVISGLPFGLTEAAIKAAQKVKFAPAEIDGQPVSMHVQLEYNFSLY